jgi:two-component system NtrC family sensor kinase
VPAVKVLIVDDSPGFLESAAQFLSAEPGYEVVGRAASGAEAIERVQALRPDVVLMDVAMPGMSGIEAARRIKALPAPPRILIVSVYDSGEHRRAAEAAGADGYVGKWEFVESVLTALGAILPATKATAVREPRAARLRTLAHLNHVVSASLNLEEVLRAIAEAASQLMGSSLASFWTADEATRTITRRACSSEDLGTPFTLDTMAYGEGVAGWVAEHRRTLHVPDVLVHPGFRTAEWARQHGAVSMLAVPVTLQGSLLAVLTMLSPRPFALGPEEHDLLDAFVAQAAAAIRNARLYEEMRRTRDFLQSITEHSGDAIMATDREGRVTFFNRRAVEMFACPADQVVGRSIRTLYPFGVRGAAEHEDIEREIFDVRAIHRYETVFETSDGRRVDASASIAPILGQDGEVTGSVVVIRDVSEEKRTRQTLQQTEKLGFMGSLLAGVANELNNPLSVLRGRAELLSIAAKERADERLVDAASEIVKATVRCDRIVRTFLALARRQAPQRQRLPLNMVVQEALEMLGYPLRVDGVQVTLRLADDLPMLHADPHQLHQVVVNLLSNAHQAMRGTLGPPRLTVTTAAQPAGRVTLEVSDSGPGVPEEIRSRIFEPFFTTKPVGQGTGLGLSLCHTIVAEHDGSIRVTDAEGGGARFVVELPVPPAAPAEAPAPTAAAAGALPPLRILVVDDEPQVLSLLQDMLTLDGHTVETVDDGHQVLARVAARPFDVVISDLRMPAMSGPQLYRALATAHPQLAQRMVFMTGDTLAADTEQFLAEVGAPTVAKPFTLDGLIEALRAAMDSSRVRTT